MKPSISHWLETEPSASLKRAERKPALLEQLVARMLCDFTVLDCPGTALQSGLPFPLRSARREKGVPDILACYLQRLLNSGLQSIRGRVREFTLLPRGTPTYLLLIPLSTHLEHISGILSGNHKSCMKTHLKIART